MNSIGVKRSAIRVSLRSLMISLTIMYSIVFPSDIANIKEIILLTTLLICSPVIIRSVFSKKCPSLVVFGLGYPIITILLSITLGESAIYDATSYGYVWFFLLLIPAIVSYDVDVKKAFIVATTIVALAIDFIWITDILNIIPFGSNPVGTFLYRNGELQAFSKGVLATFGYAIYYKSTAALFFTYGYLIHSKRYILAGAFLLAFLASGSRANLIVAVIITAAIPVFCTQSLSRRAFVVFILICVGMLILPSVFDTLTNVTLLKADRSEAVKIAGIASTFDHMNAAPYRYLFGSGIGSYFYSSGRGTYVNIFEVSFVDYFRQVGAIAFLFFLYFLARPLKWLYANQRWMFIAYLGYLAVAFTNPLLVNSTAFVCYVVILSHGFGEENISLMVGRNLRI